MDTKNCCAVEKMIGICGLAMVYNSIKDFQITAEESGSLVFTYDTKKR